MVAPDVRLSASPRTKLAHAHHYSVASYERVAWTLGDFDRPRGPYRTNEAVVARFDRRPLRAMIESFFGPAFSTAHTVTRAVLTDRHLYLEFFDRSKIKVPLTAMWGRVEMERKRGVPHDVFQIGPTFWVYFPPSAPRELIAALDGMTMVETPDV